MRRHIVFLVVTLAMAPSFAVAQGTPPRPPTPPAKGTAVSPEIAKKLYDIGYPAVGENVDLAVAQWRSRAGSKTIGALNATEVAAILAAPTPTDFGAYVGHPFTGYGISIQQKTRVQAAALALLDCRKTGGPACEVGKQLVFTGQRCVGISGYKDQLGADGQNYSAFSAYVAETAEAATAIATRNCATDADGQKYCKPLFAHCADGSNATAEASRPAQPPAAPLGPVTAPPAPQTSAPAPAPTIPTPTAQPAPTQPTPSLAAPSLAEIANRLFILGFPVSGKATDEPMTAVSQWRFRASGKPSRAPLTAVEIAAIMATPRPTVYGAFAGTTYSGFGIASQVASRELAETEAVMRCQQAKGPDCEKTRPMVMTGTRCISYAGYSGALKADGKTHTLSASGIADDPAAATRTAMARCSEQPDNAPICKPLFVLCADGRQAVEATVPASVPTVAPPPIAMPPPVTSAPAPASAASANAVRPSAEVMNRLFALGYPTTGKPYDDPDIAIAQWRIQMQRPETGALRVQEISAILSTPAPKMYLGFAGDALGVYGLASQRDSRAKAEVDAVAQCRQKRGNCDADASVVADDRCLAFAGFKDETTGKPRAVRVSGVGADPVAASQRAMKRCSEKPEDAALCKSLIVVCADGRRL